MYVYSTAMWKESLLCAYYKFRALYALELGIGSLICPSNKGNKWVREGESNSFLFMEKKTQTNHQNATKEKRYGGFLLQYTLLLSLPSYRCESSDKSHAFFSQYTKFGNSNDVSKAPWDLWVKNANSMLIFFFLLWKMERNSMPRKLWQTACHLLCSLSLLVPVYN